MENKKVMVKSEVMGRIGINLPDLKVNSNYEIDFSDRLSNALESLIEER